MWNGTSLGPMGTPRAWFWYAELGFLPARSTRDVTYILQIIGEKAHAYGRPVFLLSVDVYKAFDTVHHVAIVAPCVRGVPLRLITLL